MHGCGAPCTCEARLPSKGTSFGKGPPPDSVSMWVTLSMPRLLIAICTVNWGVGYQLQARLLVLHIRSA